MKRTVYNRFLYILSILFLLANSETVSAQGIIDEDFIEAIETNAKPYWAEGASVFTSNTSPDKWKDESAVIIGYRRSITFDKKAGGGWLSSAYKGNVFLFEKVRFKIKLQDRNAVEGFTEVYFRYGDKLDGFSAKLVKPDGTIQAVDLSDAVQVDSKSEVPEFYKSFFDQNTSNETRYYKVAIPNIEVGDVLEYVSYTKSKLNVNYSGYVEFDPQFEICSKRYPVVYNEISIDTDEKTYFKSLSQNGAPEFKKEDSDVKGFYRYVFIDKDRGTEKDINFVNPMLTYPVVKFQVIYANSEKVKGALIGNKGELKAGFSKEEIAKIAWDDYVMVGNYSLNDNMLSVQGFIDYTWAEIKKEHQNELPDDKFIQNVYYRIRNHVLFRSTYLSDKVFAYIFGSLLFQRKISSDLIITTSNKSGKLKDVLFDSEIRYAIKVNDKFYFNCTDHSNPDELVESLLGNEAYIIKEPAKKTGVQEIIPVVLPDATVNDNTEHYEITAQFDLATNKMNVIRTATYTGLTKAKEIDNIVKYTAYILDDYKIYNGASPINNLRGKQLDDYYSSVAALKEEFKTAKPELVQSELDKEYRQKVKYVNFKLVSDGRSLKNQKLVATDGFEIFDIAKHAGKKILLNITALTGSQLQITKSERTRTKDIQVGYPRSLSWKITMAVPAGYTVKGLKELNTNIENAAGKFSCEATEENGNISISIVKVYKQKNMPKENWNDMLAFIDAAYNNIFKYILLQPK